MSAKEIMECIKLKDKTYFLDKYLYPAMEEGYVEQLYPENPKYPKQKYLLTEKGKVRKDFISLKEKFSISSFPIFQAFSSDFLFLEYCLHGYGEKMGVEQSF